MSGLIGRDRDVAEVVAKLREAKLVTVVGPGGVGKTAIVRAVIEALGARAVWVDLSGRHELASARDAVAEALGAAPDGIVAALSGCELVVLDSVDGLDVAPDDARALAVELATWVRSAKVGWLVTSRRALGLEDERVVRLDGLSARDAERLFIERARARASGFVMGEADRSWLARLDGMPLAIRIAASRAAQLGAEQVAGRGIEALVWSAPETAARHESVRATVMWSIERLRTEDRALLETVANFAGPFDVDDAVELAGEQAVAGLERLAAASLVSVGARLSLFDTVTEVARTEHGRKAYVELVARRCEAALPHLFDGDPRVAHAACARYADDLYQAFRWAGPAEVGPIGLGLAAHLAGRSDEAHRVLDEVLARLAEGAWRFRALHMRSRVRYLAGRLAEAEDDAARCLAEGRGDEAHEAALLMSAIERESGRGEAALARCAEVAQKSSGVRACWAQLHFGSAALMIGRTDEGHDAFLRALGKARALGAARIEALATANLGFAALEQQDLATAHVRFEQAFEAFGRIGDPLVGAKVAVALARVRRDLGQEVEPWVARAEEVAWRLADRSTQIEVHLLRAELLERAGKPGEARARLEEALATALAAGRAVTAERVRERLGGARVKMAEGAWWFEAGGARVELKSRVALRRVLATLVEQRLRSPGSATSTNALVEAGWPGERISAEAAADRVYAAVGALRRMGLEGVLVRRDGGYALAPEVPLVVV